MGAVHDQLFGMLISKGILTADEAKAALYQAAERLRHQSEALEAANIVEGSVSEIAFELASGLEQRADRLG